MINGGITIIITTWRGITCRIASLGRYWCYSRPRRCSRADIPAWRPKKSHYFISLHTTNISLPDRHILSEYVTGDNCDDNSKKGVFAPLMT